MRKTKKFVFVILIIVYILGSMPSEKAMAQVVTDPSPEPVVTVEGPSTSATDPSPATDASPSTDPSLSSDPTPTPSPSPDPCPTDCATLVPAETTQTNDVAIDNQLENVSDTGNNTIGDPAVSPETADPSALEATDSAQLTTEETPVDPASTSSQSSQENPGDSTSSSSESQNTDGSPAAINSGEAIAEANIVNLANTNVANSSTDFQVENIFGTETGDITLTSDDSAAPEPSLLLVNQQNTATVTNYILVYANSGWNLIKEGTGDIQTGTAYAAVNVFNFVNANLEGSNISFAVINIFGKLIGDIVLPEPAMFAALLNGIGNTTQSNSAVVENSVNNTAVTGNNSLEGDGQIATGNAASLTNLANYTNSNMVGTSFYHLIINNYGTWNGQFLGWGNLDPTAPRYGQMVFDISNMPEIETSSAGGELTQQNDAKVLNSISATASTGGNSIYGAGTINTGDAFSAVNLLNFINSNWSHVQGFFGMINIFGTLEGDIGGADHFLVNTETFKVEDQNPQETSQQQSPGGQLSTAIQTNVGTHVNPGDTVMFFIDVKNTGSGPVNDAKLTFNLRDTNYDLGVVQTFDLGNLAPGEKAIVSFGLVLSDEAPTGLYGALTKTTGKVGPDGSEINSFGRISFQVGEAIATFVNNFPGEVKANNDIAAALPPTEGQIPPGGGEFDYLKLLGSLYLLLLSSKIYYHAPSFAERVKTVDAFARLQKIRVAFHL